MFVLFPYERVEGLQLGNHTQALQLPLPMVDFARICTVWFLSVRRVGSDGRSTRQPQTHSGRGGRDREPRGLSGMLNALSGDKAHCRNGGGRAMETRIKPRGQKTRASRRPTAVFSSELPGDDRPGQCSKNVEPQGSGAC